jgi:hypothetical protein
MKILKRSFINSDKKKSRNKLLIKMVNIMNQSLARKKKSK